jgi:hypothetical protein
VETAPSFEIVNFHPPFARGETSKVMASGPCNVTQLPPLIQGHLYRITCDPVNMFEKYGLRKPIWVGSDIVSVASPPEGGP